MQGVEAARVATAAEAHQLSLTRGELGESLQEALALRHVHNAEGDEQPADEISRLAEAAPKVGVRAARPHRALAHLPMRVERKGVHARLGLSKCRSVSIGLCVDR